MIVTVPWCNWAGWDWNHYTGISNTITDSKEVHRFHPSRERETGSEDEINK